MTYKLSDLARQQDGLQKRETSAKMKHVVPRSGTKKWTHGSVTKYSSLDGHCTRLRNPCCRKLDQRFPGSSVCIACTVRPTILTEALTCSTFICEMALSNIEDVSPSAFTTCLRRLRPSLAGTQAVYEQKEREEVAMNSGRCRYTLEILLASAKWVTSVQ